VRGGKLSRHRCLSLIGSASRIGAKSATYARPICCADDRAGKRLHAFIGFKNEVARPKRFELLTPRFVVLRDQFCLVRDGSQSGAFAFLSH
jgi:hypothetical protein